jgi:cell division protein FtsB
MKKITLLALIFTLTILLSGCEPLYEEVDSVWANDHQIEALETELQTLRDELDITYEEVDEMEYGLRTDMNDLRDSNIALQEYINELIAHNEIQERIDASYIKALEERLYVIENKDKISGTMDFTQHEYYDMVTLENGNTREITITYQRSYIGGYVGQSFAILSIEYCADTCTTETPNILQTIDEMMTLANEWLEQE